MGKLVDICGEPIDLSTVKDFHLGSRDYIYYPYYEEIPKQRWSIFSRIGDPEQKFQFQQMIPYGVILGEREKPSLGGYEIKSFGEAAGKYILQSVGEAITNIGNIAADLFRIDTSSNHVYTVLTAGRRTTNIRLRDIPARVKFLSGKVSDVYKNDTIFGFLGEPIAPVFARVQTLVINTERKTLVFFGNGIDLDNPRIIYDSLIEHHNMLESTKEDKKRSLIPQININLPKVNIPKIEWSKIRIPSSDENKKQDEQKKGDN